MANNSKEKVKAVEDKIRDLINDIKVMNEEELKEGEGKKIEDDAAEELIKKLKAIASAVGNI
ncbi:hypothetical protein COS75_01190 [Candidatus Pacearchaeota archaeon CG06_land_8_20_14_3_00_35_12]|nr:MAG: hypothetical protein COS75_01190 [Candidatus Pacearchaeota archaeon CG06_land_8_20_14_3_00_35_12]